jgi:hypothetical protein
MAKGMKIAKGVSGGIQIDSAITPEQVTILSATGTNTSFYMGGVGGEPTGVTATLTIKCSYKMADGTSKTDGFIVEQRGRKSFYVQSDTDTATKFASTTRTLCVLTAVAAGSLTASQMSILCSDPTGATFYASRITNRFVWNGNTRYRYTVVNNTQLTFIDTYNAGTKMPDGVTGLAIVEGQ